MLFVRRPTIIVEDEATHAEQTRLAEERGMNSGAVAVLGIVGLLAVILLVGYFAWWAPMNIQHDHIVTVPAPAPTNGSTNGGAATDAGNGSGASDAGATAGATGTTGTTTGQ
jgi:hypothetical protein